MFFQYLPVVLPLILYIYQVTADDIEFLPPFPEGNENTLNVSLGQQVYLSCSIPNPSPGKSYTYQWIVPATSNVTNYDHYWFTGSFAPEQEGEYVCVASDGENTIQKTAFVRLAKPAVFMPETGDTQTIPNFQVYIARSRDTPVLREDYILVCSVRPAFPNVIYRWKVEDRADVIEGSELILRRFTKTDYNKQYECQATVQGLSRSAVYVSTVNFFKETELALQTSPGPEITVHVNERKELHCEIDSAYIDGQRVHGTQIVWTLNGRPITAPDSQLNAERIDRYRVSILVLARMSLLNEGKYECRLRSVIKEAEVIVISDTKTLYVNPETQTVNEGEVAEMHCRILNVVNVQNTDLKWFFLGKRRDGSRQVLREEWELYNNPSSIETSFIALASVKKADEGFYMCLEPGGYTAIGELIVPASESRGPIEISVTPQETRLQTGQVAHLECVATRDGAPFGNLMWSFSDGRSIANDPRFQITDNAIGRSALTVVGLTERDPRTEFKCYVEDVSAVGVILVEAECGITMLRCRSGKCIERSRRCDGRRDCDDGTDEDPEFCKSCDPVNLRCETNNGIPPASLTYSANWVCDGEDDCGNGFDERGCTDRADSCENTMFQCEGGNRIPRAYLCDGEPDCNQNEDEMSCSSSPIIIPNASQSKIRTLPGNNVTLRCVATGNPWPKIIWRYNWRCLPETTRINVQTVVPPPNCDRVESVLTISDAQFTDDGIYNCEALGPSSRALSNDYQVVVTDRG